MDNRSDEALLEAIRDELSSDARIDQSQIDVGVGVGVGVADGVVTLVGTVGSYAEKLVVEETASTVAGVHDLVNDLEVKHPVAAHPNDGTLHQLAQQLLIWDAIVPAADLTVKVEDGWIELSGQVDLASQANEAERLLARLTGVRGITSRITVAEPDLTPDQVRHAMNQALQRRAAHRANHIDVIIDGRSVTLRGPTQSQQEKTAILGAVGHAPGVDEVHDELRTDS